ncbi:hypothetical protein SAMN04487970_100780 [Paenibacillus tianmuensis]|uniref:Uncharacterized protein n=1 Tax=Paenibacillus tianmuensis TaxID=624147 RepID=A0A1G4QIE6_9BACL|nr:hypothetical protein [Paenibacillus tianmuensis]SCW44225.1 hypothetical protein SAMN04487970_100780 [Paenibacillus tianmuensis]
MSISTYKQSVRYRNAAIAVLVLLLLTAGFKMYAWWKKAELYQQAAAQLAAGNAVEAEELFLKAQNIGFIDYKEAEMEQALSALQPVTQAKRLFSSLTDQIASAVAVNDAGSLVKAYESYQASKSQVTKLDEGSQKRFAETAASYNIDARFAEAFGSVKTALIQNVEGAVAKKKFDTDTAVGFLLQIPAVYYKDEAAKRKALNPLLQKYDQGRLDAIVKSKSLDEMLKEGGELQKFYKDRGWEAPWVAARLEKAAQDTLVKLEKNDLGGFLAAAKTVQSNKELFSNSSKLNGYIQTVVNGRLARAEQLIAAKKYAEADELYKTLDAFRDTSKELQALDQRRLESDPAVLFQKAGIEGALTAATSLKGSNGAQTAAAAVTDKKKLVLVRLFPDQRIEVVEGAVPGDLAAVKSLRPADELSPEGQPVLLLEAASKKRKARYVAFEAHGSELKPILDLEADKLETVRKGVVSADNPVPERTEKTSADKNSMDKNSQDKNGTEVSGPQAGAKAVYEYRSGRYVFVKFDKDFTTDNAADTDKKETKDGAAKDAKEGAKEVKSIVANELPKHKNAKVVFQCDIQSVTDNRAIVKFDDLYIVLTGKFKFSAGPAVVTGTYTSTEDLKQGNKTVKAYIVQVSSLVQDEEA